MSGQRILGLALLAVGIVLLAFGYNASQALTEQAMETITGRFSDTTTWYFATGAAGVVAGLALLAFGRGGR